MDGGPGREHGNKKQLTISLAPDIHEWMLSQIRQGEYANVSHAIERGLRLLKKYEELMAQVKADTMRLLSEHEAMGSAKKKDAPGRIRGSNSKSP